MLKKSEKIKREAVREKGINIVIGQKHFPESGSPGWIFIFHNFFIIFFYAILQSIFSNSCSFSYHSTL